MPYSWKPLLLLLLPYLSFCQAPFDCNGRIFRVLEEQGGSTFQEIRIDYDNQKAEFEDLAFFSGLQLNGMCYRPADNLIYGVQLGPDIIAEPGESLVLAPDIQSSSPLAYLFWSENSGHTLSCNTCETPEVFPLETGLYRLEISNLNGCTAEDNLSIIVLPFHYYAPTAFSPNGDQINDLFLLYGRRDFAIRHFRVFDRWGNLACHKEQMRANDPSTGWNGAFNGKPLNSGVYVWTAEAVLSNGNPINISGEVHLIR
ncbi:MAG: gliding motility-associated C-terminal domain-containing protein [Phaeodactylibacter sp.]|nr:gliding motility-associated C-terminal domain-containing protein [Phaeodactylibacter sp.]